ncbi:MAG: DUF790 family protein [Candidatus Korarchaeota archaeon]
MEWTIYLPFSLIETSIRKERIYPRFLNIEEIVIVARVISTFKENVGKKYSVVISDLEEIEEYLESDYKIARGLGKILEERHAKIESKSAISPKIARDFAFARGPALSLEKRKKIIEEGAKEFNISPDEFEQALWADFPDEKILTEVEDISPRQLLEEYNLGVLEAILLHATDVTVYSDNTINIVSVAKMHGLMYDAVQHGNKIILVLYGPFSTVRLTKKYGILFAKLVPYIIAGNEWKISANILKDQSKKKLFKFELSSSNKPLLPTIKLSVPTFDSEQERKFVNAFSGIDIPWKLERYHKPILVGNILVFPDFRFFREESEVFVELVGFWTPNYLKKKLNVVGKRDDLIFVVDKKLTCEKFENLWGVFYFHGNRFPVKEIIEFLRNRMEKKQKITPSGDIIDLQKIADAQKCGVSELIIENIDNYAKIDKRLYHRDFLKSLESLDLEGNFEDVKKILVSRGVFPEDVIQILHLLRYDVKWEGLTPTTVKKISS